MKCAQGGGGGVQGGGHLRVHCSATERYRWSYRSLTSQFSLCALCGLPLVHTCNSQNSSGGHRCLPRGFVQPMRHVAEGDWVFFNTRSFPCNCTFFVGLMC